LGRSRHPREGQHQEHQAHPWVDLDPKKGAATWVPSWWTQRTGPIYSAISMINFCRRRHHQHMTSPLQHKADIPVWKSLPTEDETSQIPWVQKLDFSRESLYYKI
jgi:hypothetical protein